MRERRKNASITNVQSFRPELEFEVIKIVLLRENYLKRIKKTLLASKGKIDIGVVGLFDVLRETSIEVVDTIQTWEQTQFDYPHDTKPFVWNGLNYLEKMCGDCKFLHDFPAVGDWLGFSPECNPFFLPPEALGAEVVMKENAFVVFGVRPPPPPKQERAKAIMPKFVKSPYLTPIHNDLDVFPQNSAVNKAKAKDKLRAAAQAEADRLQALGKDRAKDAPTDPYQSFVSATTITKARGLLAALVKANGGRALNTSLSTIGYSPSSSYVTATGLPGTSGMSGMPPGPGSPMKSTISGVSGTNANQIHDLPPAPAAGGRALGSTLDQDGSMLHEAVQVNETMGGSPSKAVHGIQTSGVPGSPTKQSLVASVGHTGQFAGRLGSTSIFSQNRDDFTATQENFRQSLAASTAEEDSLHNKAMGLQSIVDNQQRAQMSTSLLEDSQFGEDNGSVGAETYTSNTSKIWTPHEITLQRAVRRRGGELFVLTAAATKGRIKAPSRRTRFERLEKDLKATKKQAEVLQDNIQKSALAVEQVAAELAKQVRF